MRVLESASLTALGLALHACHVHVDDGPSSTAYHESEPNDEPALADDFGDVALGEHLCIEGYMSLAGDSADALAFEVESPCVLEFRLAAQNSWTDLDVWVFDPWLWAYVAAFESAGPIEDGRIVLDTGFDTPLQLVIVPYSGASHYRLDVESRPIGYPSAHGGDAAGPRRDRAGHPVARELRSFSRARAAIADL